MLNLTMEEREFIKAHIRNGEEMIRDNDVDTLLDRLLWWNVLYGYDDRRQRQTEGGITLSKLFPKIKERNKKYLKPKEEKKKKPQSESPTAKRKWCQPKKKSLWI